MTDTIELQMNRLVTENEIVSPGQREMNGRNDSNGDFHHYLL